MILNQSRKQKLIGLCSELVAIPSLSGCEKEMALALEETGETLGFDEVNIDEYGNVIIRITGSKTGKTILFDAHIDTVGVSDEDSWNYAPYSSNVRCNRIYGRGSADMKGALASMMMAAKFFADDSNSGFAGDIYVVGTVMEETFEGVAARSVSETVQPDFVIIGEPSNLNIKRGQRGRAEIVIKTQGQSAHSSSPQVGHNAVYDMIEIVRDIKTITPPEHDILGKGIMELTDIISRPYPGASVIPNLCRVTFDRRLLLGETEESTLAPLRSIVDRLKTKNMQANIQFAVGETECWTGKEMKAKRFFPAWLLPREHPLIMAAQKALDDIGLCPELTHYSFCTNGSHYAGEKNIPTIGFGPSSESMAHTTDEYVEIDQLVSSCAGYYSIMRTLTE